MSPNIIPKPDISFRQVDTKNTSDVSQILWSPKIKYSPFFGCELPEIMHEEVIVPLDKRILIIGDVHGCLSELKNILKKMNYSSDTDYVFLIGDLINKGPNSIGVVRYAMENNFYAIRGNNEDRVLGYVIKSTIEPSYVFAKEAKYLKDMSTDMLSWINKLPYTIKIKRGIIDPEGNKQEINNIREILLVHAGLLPGVSLEQQDPYLMVKMRGILCNDNGVLSGTDHKEASAWIDYWYGPEFVVFGHDSDRGLQKTDDAIGIDTGCVYGKHLTGMIYNPITMDEINDNSDIESLEHEDIFEQKYSLLTVRSNFDCSYHSYCNAGNGNSRLFDEKTRKIRELMK